MSITLFILIFAVAPVMAYGTLIVACTIFDLKDALRKARDEAAAWQALAADPAHRPVAPWSSFYRPVQD